jgi:glutamate dehydrogenase
VFGLRELWEEIDALDNRVPARTQIAMLLRARILAERATRWLLRHRRRPLDVAEAVSQLQPGVAELAAAIPTLLGPAERQAARSEADELAGAGVPEELAVRVAHLKELVSALDIVEIASTGGLARREVAETYFALAGKLDLHWLRDQITALPRETRWESLARGALRDDLYSEQAELTAEVLRFSPDGLGSAERIARWVSGHAPAVERCLQLIAEVKAGATVDLPTLSVAVREIRNLIQATAAAPAPVSAREVPASAAGDGR